MQEAFSVMEGGLLEGFLFVCIASAGRNSFRASRGASAWGCTLSSRQKPGEDAECNKSVGGEGNSKVEGNEEISDSSYMGGEAAVTGLGQGSLSMGAE